MKKVICAIVVFFIIVLPITARAETDFEKNVIETYRLSEKSVEFLREHNVDFEVFSDATVYPEDHPVNYNRSIESLILQVGAYGFNDEQVNLMVKGIINADIQIFGGKYDNSGRPRVYVASCPVVVNGEKFEYETLRYPILSCNDIFYFPMTWHYARLLGVTTIWSYENVFLVETKPEIAQSQIADVVTSINEPSYLPKVWNNEEYLFGEKLTYSVYINGDKIDNESEEYPVINFRGVTYFPLTEKFTEIFNWNLQKDGETLSISKNSVVD